MMTLFQVTAQPSCAFQSIDRVRDVLHTVITTWHDFCELDLEHVADARQQIELWDGNDELVIYPKDVYGNERYDLRQHAYRLKVT